MPTRRSVLALAGSGLAGLAGCTGDGPGTPTDATTRTTDDPTTTTTVRDRTDPATSTTADPPATPVPSVEAVSVHRSVRTVRVAHLGVRGGLYVVAAVATDDAAGRARSTTALALDGESRDPLDRIVRPVDGSSGVAFEVPAEGVDADTGQVAVGDDAWPLDDAALARLADPPVFSVESFEVSGEADAGDAATATLTVANTGGTDGRFLAELGSTRLSDRGEVAVPVLAGERTTHRETVHLYDRSGSDAESIVLEWPGGRRERTVEYADGG